MIVQGWAWHFVAVAALLLIGVPTNVAVIWIHTRKNSRVAKNKFPLIFAVIDLISLLVSLPLRAIAGGDVHLDMTCALCEIRTVVGIYVLNSYLTTLLMATVDKFFAVMRPFKYDSSHKCLQTAAWIFAFGVSCILTAAASVERYIVNHDVTWSVAAYNITLGLMFLTVVGLFLAIAVRLIFNERKLRKVGAVSHRLVHA